MAQYLLPTSDVTTSGWSGTPLWQQWDEGFGAGRGSGSGPDDSTTIASADIPSTGTAEVALSAGSAPVSGTHTLRVRHYKASSSGESYELTVTLVSGSTTIASFTAADAGATWTTNTYNLTGAEISSITAYNDLRIRLDVAKTGGGAGRTFYCSAVEYELPDAPTPKSGTDSGSGSDSSSVVYRTTGTDVGTVDQGSGSALRPFNAGSSVTSLSSTTAWTNPSYIDSDDSNFATNLPGSGQQTEWLYAYQASGTSVPGGATVVGIQVEIADYSSIRANDLEIRLTKNGVDFSSGSASIPEGAGWQAVGSSTSMWGYGSITPAEANSSTFGVFCRVYNMDPLSDSVAVDAIRFTVYWEGGGGAGEVAVTSSDTGAKSGTDSATGTEGTSTLTASITATETGSGADSSALAASVTGTTDTGSGADASTLAAAYALTDTGAGVDSASVGTASLTATETGSGADVSALAASITATEDTGSGVDSGVSSILFARTDSGTGTDSATVGTASLTATDTGAGSEASSLVASATATDTGSGVDASTLTVAFTPVTKKVYDEFTDWYNRLWGYSAGYPNGEIFSNRYDSGSVSQSLAVTGADWASIGGAAITEYTGSNGGPAFRFRTTPEMTDGAGVKRTEINDFPFGANPYTTEPPLARGEGYLDEYEFEVEWPSSGNPGGFPGTTDRWDVFFQHVQDTYIPIQMGIDMQGGAQKMYLSVLRYPPGPSEAYSAESASAVNFDQVYKIRLKVAWSTQPDGYVKWYIDDVLVGDYQGATMQAGESQPNTQFGWYSTDSLTSETVHESITRLGQQADEGTGTDSGAVSVPVSGTDSGAGSEASTLAAAYALTDTGAGTDTATVGIASLTATDSGTLSGEVATTSSGAIPKSGTDSGSGSEASALVASITATTDTGSGADAGTLAAAYTATDASSHPTGGSDDFNRADEDLTTPWVKGTGSTGTFSVSSNQATRNDTSNDSYYYYDGAITDEADQWSEATYVGGSKDAGPAVRIGGDGTANLSCYLYIGFGYISKFVNGSWSSLGAATSVNPGDRVRIQVSGSTVSIYINGVHDVSVTDTDVPNAGQGPGIFIYQVGSTWDDYELGPLRTESGTVSVPVAATDSGAGTDSATVATASITATDTGAGTESGLVDPAVLATTETGSGAEASSLAAVLSATESGSATESATATTAGGPEGTDAGSGSESSSLAVSFDDGTHASFPSGSWTPMDFNAGAATASSVATTSNSNWYGGPYWVDQGDGSWFQGPVDVSSYGEDLRLLSWGFAATQKPRWVIVEFEWTQTHNGSYAGLGIQLTKNGGSSAYKSASIGGPNDEGYPTRIIFDVFGSLTPAEMNSANFGVLFYGYTAAATSEFTVGNVKVSVVYETETATVSAATAGLDSGSGSDSAVVMVALAGTDTGSGSDAVGPRGFAVSDSCMGTESLGDRALTIIYTAVGVDTADAAWNLASLPDSSLALTAEGDGTLTLTTQGEGSVALSTPTEDSLQLFVEPEDYL